MPHDPSRSRAAREAAERALIRVVHHYGSRPEFVLLGGLVPELLCSASPFQHAGTTDVDVQLNPEIDCGAVNTARLEQALRNAEFEPDEKRVWRWTASTEGPQVVVKFELLADLDDEPAQATVEFDSCDQLGAANLRGTGYAADNPVVHQLRAREGGVQHVAEVNVTGLAGFLLAKSAAARSRRKAKDWYDIAFVLLHNDVGGPAEAAEAVLNQFAGALPSERTTLDDLAANFATPSSQGPTAYSEQMMVDHPGFEVTTLAADAVVAVEMFTDALTTR